MENGICSSVDSVIRRKSIWIGLGKYDNAPFVFFKLFCIGILSIQSGNDNIGKIVRSPLFQSTSVEQTLNFLKELKQVGQSYTLVLDDLHTISNKQILKSLSFVLKQMPPSFHVLLLSRITLPGELEELVMDKSSIITAKELAFTTQEIRGYYGTLGRSLTKDQVQDAGLPLENYAIKNIWEKWDSKL